MFPVISLKLLGLSYEKISNHSQLLLNVQVTGAAITHTVMRGGTEEFGPTHYELVDDC